MQNIPLVLNVFASYWVFTINHTFELSYIVQTSAWLWKTASKKYKVTLKRFQRSLNFALTASESLFISQDDLAKALSTALILSFSADAYLVFCASHKSFNIFSVSVDNQQCKQSSCRD